MRLRSRDVADHHPTGPAGKLGRTPSALLALPDGVLQEVLSWSPDGAAAGAFFGTCRALHQLREDPAAVALLLVRCPHEHFDVALASYARSQGGGAALVRQVLQLLHHGSDPHSGSPSSAPPRLLQALLEWACAQGDAASIESLLALPQPPDLAADTRGGACPGSSSALELALLQGPHAFKPQTRPAGTSQQGDPPCADVVSFSPARLAVLQLLLSRMPQAALAGALSAAVTVALCHSNLPGLDFLLPVVPAADPALRHLTTTAAVFASVETLQLVLRHRPASLAQLSMSLLMAAEAGRASATEVLLELGAQVNAVWYEGGPVTPLLLATRGKAGAADSPEEQERRRETCRVLLQHGAVVTPAVAAAQAAAAAAAAAAAQLPSGPAAD